MRAEDSPVLLLFLLLLQIVVVVVAAADNIRDYQSSAAACLHSSVASFLPRTADAIVVVAS